MEGVPSAQLAPLLRLRHRHRSAPSGIPARRVMLPA
jgi:hypothetical protein